MDRREKPRVSVEYPVILKRLDVEDIDLNIIAGKSIDLSETGIGVEVNEILPVNCPIQIKLKIQDNDSLTLESRTVRVEDSPERKLLGLKILSGDIAELSKVRYILSRRSFEYDITVYLKDTNAFGNTYFSRYFEWQGMAREAWFMRVKNYGQIIQSGIKLITCRASIEYKHEALPFDQIRIQMQFRNIKRCSLELAFRYYNKITNRLLATGMQIITFADSSGKLTRIPCNILNLAQVYLEG